MLVQREMESGRAPLASITPIPRRSHTQPEAVAAGRKWAAAQNVTGFKKKEVSVGGSHSQQGARRSGKRTGYEKNNVT